MSCCVSSAGLTWGQSVEKSYISGVMAHHTGTVTTVNWAARRSCLHDAGMIHSVRLQDALSSKTLTHTWDNECQN